MYVLLRSVLEISVVLLLLETIYVFSKIKTKMHAYIFFYLISCLVNNAGYLMEMTATSSEAAYTATQMLYLGKCFIPAALLLFVLRFCHCKVPKFLPTLIIIVHSLTWFIVCTNKLHHLYYSSVDFVTTGLFPHNVYGHGAVYYIYQSIPLVYAIVSVAIIIKNLPKMRSAEEKKQLFFLIAAPLLSVIGMGIFLTGITQGFDTTNIGIVLSSIFMIIAMFKYNLIATEDMVKDNLVDNLKDGILVIDAYNTVSYVNETAKELLPGIKLYSPAGESGLFTDLDTRAKNKEKLVVHDRVYALSYEELFQGNIYRGKLYLMDDITETENYTKQIEAERDRADEANSAKSNFLSSMSHEIRTPMTGIVGMTDILLQMEADEQKGTYLQNIRTSGMALLDIINDILDFSKIESGKMSIVEDEYESLPMLEDMKLLFRTRIGDKPLRLIYEIDEKLPAKLFGDSVRIRQCIVNLVNNAIKFTDVGYVKLCVDIVDKRYDTVTLKISVIDTGTGIREEEMAKLFESFGQLDAKRNHAKGGTGLGLTITKQLIEMMGGNISVKSEYGKGSEFDIIVSQKIVDATLASSYQYTQRSENLLSFAAPDARILLVDDNEINVKVAVGLLAPFKMQVDVADNGLVALKRISENHYDLVLMDHMMPVMDGIEATQRIREFDGEYFKRIPIVALTANAINGAKDLFLNAGMNDFVAKPISVKDIGDVMRKWLPKELIIENGTTEEVNVEAKSQSDTNKENNNEEDKDMGGELDRSIGIQYCGTEELYESVLEDFYKLIDTKAAKIEELLSQNDIKTYTVEVHALKSTARMIGATKLSELAYEMEMAGNAQDMEAINSKTPVLMEMYRSYKETLGYFDAGAGNSGDKEEVPIATIKNELQKMHQAAEDFDMDAIDECMDNLKKYKMPTEDVKEMIDDLDIMVRDVALDEIKEKTQFMTQIL